MTKRKNLLSSVMTEVDAYHNNFVRKIEAIESALDERRKLRS